MMKKYWPYLGDNTLFTFPFRDAESSEKAYCEYMKYLHKMQRQGTCEQVFIHNAWAFSFRKWRVSI